MKILLINPPNQNEITGCLPAFVTRQRGYNPPLGLLYLAGYLQQYNDHHVKIIDSQVEEIDFDQLKSKVSKYGPDVVGITALTMTLLDVMMTVRAVKETNKDIRIVLGGPHVHLYPQETIELDGVDYVVQGEGEKVFCELVDNLDNKEVLKSIKGFVFKDEGEIVNTGLSVLTEDIDSLPFPARNLIPYNKYTSILTKETVVTTIFTSRGCPYACSFCDRHHLGKKFRARSAKNVLDEIQECVEMEIKGFLFYDDTFTINKQRVIEICQGIIDRGLDITWSIRSRVDTIDAEMLSCLKKAGCQVINYGVESGSDKVLKRLNKGISIDKVYETFDLTRKSGIQALAYFMIGNPAEQKNDIYETFKVMHQLKPDYVHIAILTPFPGTKIYSEALDKKIIPYDCWKEFAKKPYSDFVMPHWGENFSMGELEEILIKGYKGFYCRGSYILRSLLKIRSLDELRKKVIAGLQLIFSKGQ